MKGLIKPISIIFSFLLIYISLAKGSSFQETELFVISWGNEPGQLKISPEIRETGSTLEDSTDDDIVPSIGPNHSFVDNDENCYFSSYGHSQVKGFTNTGVLIVNYSKNEVDFNPSIYEGAPSTIYVDTLQFLYILDALSPSHNLAIVDMEDSLISKLNPYGPDSEIKIVDIYRNSNDVLTLFMGDNTYHSYVSGIFKPGGSRGWRALDGYYYYINRSGTSNLRLRKMENPGITGSGTIVLEKYFETTGEYIKYSEFLGVDDQYHIYVFVREADPLARKIYIFNSDLDYIDEMPIPIVENMYNWIMRPFMRPSDGNIYEFRCLDDGLHVIRWSKE